MTDNPIVYYVQRGNVVKIGTTAAPHRRFAALMPDEILAFEPGDAKTERMRHRQFRHLRCQGEHFRPEPDLLEHVRLMRQVHGDPDPSWPTAADLGKQAVVPVRAARSHSERSGRFCSQHQQPRGQCPPYERHVQTLRCTDELFDQVGDVAEALGVDRNAAVVMALEAFVRVHGVTAATTPVLRV